MSAIAVAAVQAPPRRVHGFPGPRRSLNRLSRLSQALDLQDLLAKVANALGNDLENQPDGDKRARLAVAIASAGRSWQGLQTEVMALRGQGKPKPVEARNGVKRGKQTNAAPVSERNGSPDASHA